MAHGPASEVVVPLETKRMLLRSWRVGEAAVQRQLWLERDPRVPPHRRIDAEGRPTVGDLEEATRVGAPLGIRLLALERKVEGDVIGYCGLVAGDRTPDPELTFELLHRVWGQGYATEAACAVLHWARSSGHQRLWATVWEWNTASLRILAKVGFVVTDKVELDAVRGRTLFLTTRL